MDLFNIKPPGVCIFTDLEEAGSSSSGRQDDSQPANCSSTSKLRSVSRPRPCPYSSGKSSGKPVVRKASNHELQLSSPHRSRVEKSALQSFKANQLPRFDLSKEPAKAPLRRYRTEPVILALKEQIKKETGITPKTPQRHENPFEPENLASVMARPWLPLDPSFLEPRTRSPEGFRWSIDHMATLNPVEISHQDVLRTELLKHVHTDSDEDHCQANIRIFFDEDSFHPPTPSTKSFTQPDGGISDIEEDSRPDFSPKFKPYTLERIPSFGAKDVACQTDVHISPKFNFEKYFATYQIYGSQTLQEPFGNVRRRLFTDIEEEARDMSMTSHLSPSGPPLLQMDQSGGFDVENNSLNLSFGAE